MPFAYELTAELGSAAPSALSHQAAAVARLAQYIKTRPNFLALLGAITAQADSLETALQQLANDRRLSEAFGAQLDVIGAIVKQPRADSPDDATYRARIRARIALNRCSGTAEEIYRILALVKPELNTLRIRDDYPAAFSLIVGGALTGSLPGLFLSFLRLARSGGVRAILEWTGTDPDETFTLDAGSGAQSLDNGALSTAAV